MGGGIKSKFKFPVPGRSTKKQLPQTVPPPPVPVQNPLINSGSMSKAQRILGADGLNIGSSRLTVGVDRLWETGSSGGISISISDSNASQVVHETHYDQKEERKTRWEDGPIGGPRMTRSATDLDQKGLKMQRSALTVGDESREDRPKMSMGDRRLSSSTEDSHYEPKRMPLAISQQTSNSAMAKGLPMRPDEPGSPQGDKKKKKKKPARLDLSRLRPKGHRDRNKDANAEHDDIFARASPFARKTSKPPQPNILSPPAKGITDSAALHKLYDQYEQMSFQEDEVLEAHGDENNRTHAKPAPASTFNHMLLAPSPPRLRREQASSNHWSHSRNDSHDSSSKNGSVADSSGGLHAQSASKQEYAGSVSSRYTRTSKASNRSAQGSDRLQHSILSLSDSSDDEGPGSSPSMPTSSRGSFGSENPNIGRGQQNAAHSHAVTSQKKFTPSLHQLDEHLAVKSATSVGTNRQPSINSSISTKLPHSNHSSMSTLTPSHATPVSSRFPHSARSTETSGSLASQTHSSNGTHEGRRPSYAHLAPLNDAIPDVSPTMGVHHPEKIALRQSSSSASRFSHSSGQPTPPISPNSVEFYVKSRESLQRDAIKNGASETSNARLMAVTKQEEMLLAMLREKRAQMRETATPDVEMDKRRRASHASHGSPGFAMSPGAIHGRIQVSGRSSSVDHRMSPTTSGGWPFAEPEKPKPHGVHALSTNTRTDTSTTNNFESRNERILMYLDHPTEEALAGDSSLDFSDDYMDDSDGEDLVANERRTSRMQFRRNSTFSTARGQSASSMGSRRGSGSQMSTYTSRKDSLPFHSLNPPMKSYRLQDVPEIDPLADPNEDDSADLDDDLNEFPQPPMPPPSWPLPPPPKPPAKASSPNPPAGQTTPARTAKGSDTPDSASSHLKNKKSVVRLSAVGYMDAPMPWWGDDD